MRRNINSLRTNIKFGEAVATKKVHNFLTENEHLLYEMNVLRQEVCVNIVGDLNDMCAYLLCVYITYNYVWTYLCEECCCYYMGLCEAISDVHPCNCTKPFTTWNNPILLHQVGYLREENERLHATYDMYQTRRQAHKASIPKQKGRSSESAPVNSLMPEFPVKRTDSEGDDDPPDAVGASSSNVSLTREEMIARSFTRADSAKELAKLAANGPNSPSTNKEPPNESSTLVLSPSASVTVAASTAGNDLKSTDSAPSSTYATRADQLVQELMSSNMQRIQVCDIVWCGVSVGVQSIT